MRPAESVQLHLATARLPFYILRGGIDARVTLRDRANRTNRELPRLADWESQKIIESELGSVAQFNC
jgi:hypothetical protein